MRKKYGQRRILSFFLSVAMVLSMFSAALMSVSADAPEMSNISIAGDTGYYVKNGSLFSYNVQTGKSTPVDSMTGLNADYVLYDGMTLYTAAPIRWLRHMIRLTGRKNGSLMNRILSCSSHPTVRLFIVSPMRR